MSDYNEDEREREIRERISSRKRKIERLEEYKDRLRAKHNHIDADVYAPERGYDLSVSTDIVHWAGNLESEGVGYQNSTAEGIRSFMSGISNVIETIEQVIGRLWSEIHNLERELASI